MDSKTFQKPPKFLMGYLFHFFSVSGPLEAAAFKTFIEKYKTIAFPVESFQPVTFMTTEQEKVILKWIHPEILLDEGSKTINGLSHVGITAGNKDLSCTGNIA
jgi:hypothetical protein